MPSKADTHNSVDIPDERPFVLTWSQGTFKQRRLFADNYEKAQQLAFELSQNELNGPVILWKLVWVDTYKKAEGGELASE